MSEVQRRLAQIETSISINDSLMTAALNPTAAGAVKQRLDQLHAERTELLTMIDAGAA